MCLLFYTYLFSVNITLPLSNPVQIFLLALILLLFAPLLMKRLHIPGIIGLIAAGVLVGPHGLNLLTKSGGIELLSTAGMLYIMFLAGLEIDFNDFKKNYRNGLLFGILTFIFPISIGTIMAYNVLGLNFYGALVIGCMISTHTLVSYPIIRRLGITRTNTVATAAAGTFITDTTVLLLIAVIVAANKGELSPIFWLQLCIAILLFSTTILWGFPIISRWFLRYVALDDITQYIFILTMILLSGFLAQLAGLEPIIGSFLAGFAFNRLIPHTSVLMEKIIFTGNLFIPFFLISVGMVVDINILFSGPQTLFIAFALILSSQIGKGSAAFVTQKILKYTPWQRNLLFSLSNSHAAATIAIILVGYKEQLLGKEILNSAVLLIPASCLISTLVAERYGRKIASQKNLNKLPDLYNLPQKILVPVANPNTIQPLLELALMLKNNETTENIYALSIVIENPNAQKEITLNRSLLEATIQKMGIAAQSIQPKIKIDNNISIGILRAIHEIPATEIIIGWQDKAKTIDKIFGSISKTLAHETEKMLLVPHLVTPIHTFKQITVLIPFNANVEQGFVQWVKMVQTIAKQIGINVRFLGHKITLDKVQYVVNSLKQNTKNYFTLFEYYEQHLLALSNDFNTNDFVILISARPHTASYNNHLEQIPILLTRHYLQKNFMLVYPKQDNLPNNNNTLFSDIPI